MQTSLLDIRILNKSKTFQTQNSEMWKILFKVTYFSELFLFCSFLFFPTTASKTPLNRKKESATQRTNYHIIKNIFKNIFLDIMHPPLPRFAALFCSTLAWGVRIADGLKKLWKPSPDVARHLQSSSSASSSASS